MVTKYKYSIGYENRYGTDMFVEKEFNSLKELYKFVKKPKDIYKKGSYEYHIYTTHNSSGDRRINFYIQHTVADDEWDEIEEYYDAQVAYANRMCSYDGNDANYGVHLESWCGQSR